MKIITICLLFLAAVSCTSESPKEENMAITLDKHTTPVADTIDEADVIEMKDQVFEGFFSFIYYCDYPPYSCLEHEVEILKDARSTIESQFTGEGFTLEIVGGIDDYVYLRIRCNKTIYENWEYFYPIDEEWQNNR